MASQWSIRLAQAAQYLRVAIIRWLALWLAARQGYQKFSFPINDKGVKRPLCFFLDNLV